MPQSTNIPFISQNEIYHFGLDMLEFMGDYRDEDDFTGLDFDNSNFGTIEEFGISKHDVNNYMYKIQFSIDNTPIFAFYKGNKHDTLYKGSVKTQNYFCFYGGAFRLLGEDGVLELINRFSKIQRKDCIKRFDLCIDIPFSTPDVWSTFGKISESKNMYFGKNNEIETLYIGQYKATQNKYSLIRMYNKLKELYKKGKTGLYAEYFDYDHMTRIELEVRRELAKNATIENVFNTEYQMNIFISKLVKHTPLFATLDFDKTSLFNKRKKKDWESITGIEKEQRIKTFFAYGTKIAVVLGICPLQILLEKEIFHRHTIDMIESYGIHQFMVELHRKRHWRTKINNILDRQSLYDSNRGN